MLKALICIALAAAVFAGTAERAFAAEESGTFRGRWWNYYDRGVAGSEFREFDKAENDLKKSISMRDRDQRMARTYGMHFIDYFPHRELGIVYYFAGDLKKAEKELETSFNQEESAKAAYYLNLVRQSDLKRRGLTLKAPEILITSPSAGQSHSGLLLKVQGKASGEGFIAKITVNGEPVRFDLAKKDMIFDKEIVLGEEDFDLQITAEDLMGNISSRKVKIVVDREGPSIGVSSLLSINSASGKSVRITGEIEDKSGISRVVINGKTIYAEGVRLFLLDQIIDRNSDEKAEIQAFDLLGNVTVAQIDVANDLAAFSKTSPPLLLASAGDSIFSIDREPPVISLKDTIDLPQVFVDRYYVEGEAFDNGRVERIIVNGSELSLARGKKVFFNRTVRLNEGRNLISVVVVDKAGNSSRKEFVVHRVVPSAMQVGSRMSISILPFDGKSKSAEIGRVADDFLMASLSDQKRFMLIEREKLLQLLLEQKISSEKLADQEHSIRIGKLISADAILATTIREERNSLEVVSRVINTETSEVMTVKDVYTEDKGMNSLKEIMAGLATKVAREFPLVEGMVLSRSKNELLSDIGASAKVKKSMGAIIYRKGKEVRHPATGKSLGSDTIKVGEGWFEEIQSEFSKLRLSTRTNSQNIGTKDLLITR